MLLSKIQFSLLKITLFTTTVIGVKNSSKISFRIESLLFLSSYNLVELIVKKLLKLWRLKITFSTKNNDNQKYSNTPTIFNLCKWRDRTNWRWGLCQSGLNLGSFFGMITIEQIEFGVVHSWQPGLKGEGVKDFVTTRP